MNLLVTMRYAGAAAVLATAAMGPVASAQVPDPRGLPPILFESDRKGDTNVLAMDPDGGRLVTVLRGPANDEDPAWAPSGDGFAFTSDRDGTPQIYRTTGGSTPVQLTDGPGSNVDPVWSSDGSLIAFESNRNGNWDIFVMDALGELERPVTESRRNEFDPAWKPGSHTVAFDRIDRPGSDLFERDVDTLEERQLTKTARAEFDPAYSPSGTRLAFDRLNGRDYDVHFLELDSGDVVEVAPTAANAMEPTWSPDARTLLFTVVRDRQTDVFRASEDSSWSSKRAVNLTRGRSANDSGADWRPDSASFAGAAETSGRTFFDHGPPFQCTKPSSIHIDGEWRVITGTNGEDGLCGTSKKERIIGRQAVDYLAGGGRRDSLRGGAGADRFLTDDGRVDRLFGGIPPSTSSATDNNANDKAWPDKSLDLWWGIDQIDP